MTYKKIQEEYRKLYDKTIKSCWIADVKRDLGLTIRIAPNRMDRNAAKYPCKDKVVRDRIMKLVKDSIS